MHFLPLQSGTNFRAQAFLLPSVTSFIPWFLSSNHLSSGSWPHLRLPPPLPCRAPCFLISAYHWFLDIDLHLPACSSIEAPMWCSKETSTKPQLWKWQEVPDSSSLTGIKDHHIIQASLQVGQCRLAEGAAGESHESVAALTEAKSQLGAPGETGVWNILDHIEYSRPSWIWMLTLTCEIGNTW